MPKALKITEDNLMLIINYGKTLQFNLDDIKYDFLDAIENSTHAYVITDGNPENSNVVFTTFNEESFVTLWKFKSAELSNEFVEIERV